MLLCEVEGKGELMGEKGCGLIVAEAYAAAVDLRIAMIFASFHLACSNNQVGRCLSTSEGLTSLLTAC